MAVVTFKTDIFPYVKGEVRELTVQEKARVDGVAKARNIDEPYVSGDKSSDSAVDDSRGADVQRAAGDRERAHANAIDQAAVLQAQRDAVAEPANVDALGLVSEEPQVVTGTKPVADVEVTNPQEATDPSSGKGVDVKVKGSKK